MMVAVLIAAAVAAGTNLNDLPIVARLPEIAVTVDPAEARGPIKPMNAVNNGPYPSSAAARSGSWREFKALKIPFVRSHDAAFCSTYGGEHMGDVSAIFPDFAADENDPANYDFQLTDEYVRNFAAAGAKVFFRLGQKIEHASKKYQVLPPADFGKWARIAEHIVRHYTEGWAGGFDAGIEYWEIWNEPDLDADGKWKTSPRTWGGSQADFYEFYATVAKHLKAKFPQLKIGGPAFASAPDTRDDWGGKFLRAMREGQVPIDFLSWHRYLRQPETVTHCAEVWRKLLDENGYPAAESFLDEWNYVEEWGDYLHRSRAGWQGVRGAALVAAAMIEGQRSPVDMLMYYDLRPNCGWNGVFAPNGDPLPAYWAFYAWRKLRDAGTAVKCEVGDAGAGVYATAAKAADGRLIVLVAAFAADYNAYLKRKVVLGVRGREFRSGLVKLVDSRYNFGETEFALADGKLELFLEPHALAVIEL